LNPNSTSKFAKVRVGGFLHTNKGKWIKVEKIEHIIEEVPVFNLKTVSPTHTFYANGILVHNWEEKG